jgi:hypothetical protein
MDMKHTVKFRLGMCAAIAAAAIAPTALSAQVEIRRSPVPSYHLIQLSVGAEQIAPEEFKAKTGEIKSCVDAKNLAKTLGADMKRNRFVRSTTLPENLRDEVKKLPIGHATEVFSNDSSTMRVLVLCNFA